MKLTSVKRLMKHFHSHPSAFSARRTRAAVRRLLALPLVFAFALNAGLSAGFPLFFSVSAVSPDAAYELSPGLSVIKSRAETKKCGVINTPLPFAPEDFETLLGKTDYVTFSTLPDRTLGRLYLGTEELLAGQTVSRAGLRGIRFEPMKNALGTTSFTFCSAADETKYGVCTIFLLDAVNLPPAPADSSFETRKNISYKGFLHAADPEGDAMTFSLVSGARHGTVQLLDSAGGFFMYTPKTDFTGRDIFSFRVTDVYGNSSSALRVTVHVTEPESSVTFSDMINHWAYNSALCAAEDGVFSGEISGGKLLFRPDKAMTRGDFLAVAMIGAGLEAHVTKVGVTSFSDDGAIPSNIKSYAQAALEAGIVFGYPEADGVSRSFRSAEPITRGEAEAVLARILRFTDAAGLTAAEAAAYPDGSFSAGAALSDAALVSCRGVLSGDGSGTALPSGGCITRGEGAQIYCNLKRCRAD